MWAYRATHGRVGAGLFFFLVYLLAAGCAPKKIALTASCSSRVSVLYAGPAERSYCTSVNSFADSVQVTGTAKYEAWVDTAPIDYLDTVVSRPIRHAEIEVLDASGNRVQCGTTDGSGYFDLELPRSSSALTIRVNSRAFNSHIKASVLNCPEENGLYAVSTTVTPDANKAIGTVTARANGSVIGGAFNILDQFLNANEFLRSKASSCPAGFTGCANFTVAPKVSAYWVPGFNPNSYFNDPYNGLSFYLPGYSRLFIMGGVDGNVIDEDTDHFDNSVIIHEYGHFLEDVYSDTDSPGGSHYGDRLIDPRLAWSEGWGNFLQAAVQNSPFYRDTYGVGHPDSVSHGYYFSIPLEATAGACTMNKYLTGCDIPDFDDEGNFREFSVTRLLWDAHDGGGGGTDSDADGVNDAFIEAWSALTATIGFKNPLEAFRAIGFLHEVQAAHGSSDWSSLRTSHKHGFTDEYAYYVTAQGGGCGTTYPYTMQPYDSIEDDGSFATSHLLRNNDFFFYKHGGGTVTFTLEYETIDEGSNGYSTETESDLDLYIYNSTARYGNANDIKLKAQKYYDNDPETIETETATGSLTAGDYLINVKVYTGRYTGSTPLNGITNGQYISAGSNLHYKLQVNGVDLCPAARP